MAKKKTTSRTSASKLKFETLPDYCRERQFTFEEFQEEDRPPTIRLDFPTDGPVYSLFVDCLDTDFIEKLGGIKFERFSVVSGLNAIAELKKGRVEALVDSNSYSKYSSVWFSLKDQLPLSFEGDGLTATIQGASDELKQICKLRSDKKLCSLQITGCTFSSLSDVRKTLIEVSDALFFSLELNDDLTIALARRRRISTQGFSRQIKKMFAKRQNSGVAATFPTHKYASEPMNLYRYGVFARQMPLIRYLAYYQVLEFYFPICARNEATLAIQEILKNPDFNLNDESDIGRLLDVSMVKSERDMLLTTLLQSVKVEELRKFLTEDDKFLLWFANPIEGVTKQSLNLAENSNNGLIKAVATRVYDIRCAIVHTKSGIGTDVLRPFSRYENEMYFDSELVQFLARRVLIQHRSSL